MGEAQRLDPLAAMRGEVVGIEPGGLRDGLCDRALVESGRPLLRFEGIASIDALGLPDADMEKIYRTNALKLMRLPPPQ